MPAAILCTCSAIFSSILVAVDQLSPSTTNELGIDENIDFLAVEE